MTINDNDVWIDQMKACLASLAINSPEDNVIVYLVDFDELPPLQRINPNCILVNRRLNLESKSKDEIPGCMLCHRASIVLDALNRTQSSVAYLDTDSLVRSSLETFWEKVEPNVIQVMHRSRASEKAIFQAGVFAIGFSDVTLKMMVEYVDLVKTDILLDEQKHLYTVYLNAGEDVQLVKLPRIFNDWWFRNKSVIWHCKKRHFNEAKYQNEYQHYLRIANEAC